MAGAIGLSAAGDFVALVALALRANEMQGDGVVAGAVSAAAGAAGLVWLRRRRAAPSLAGRP